MKNTNGKQPNLLEGLLGEMTEKKASGLAFSLAAVLPYLLALLFAIAGGLFGLFHEGVEQENWYLYVGYLLSQSSFAIVAVLFFYFAKTPVQSVIGKPTVWDFALAMIVQFGLLSLSGVNAWFMIWLERLGLQVQAPQIPSMDGWGFVGVILVIAVLSDRSGSSLIPSGRTISPRILLGTIKSSPVSLLYKIPSAERYHWFSGATVMLSSEWQ